MAPGRFLLNNYKQALKLISTNTSELDAYCALHPNENLDFGSWVAEELAYLKVIESEPKQDTLRVTYVEELEKLAKLEYEIVRLAVVILIHFTEVLSNHLETITSSPIIYNQLSFTPGSGLSHVASTATKRSHAARRAAERRVRSQQDRVEDLEEQLGIEPTRRWTSDQREYVEMREYSRHRQFIRAVEELENLVVQRLFELSKANLASTGAVVSLSNTDANYSVGYKLRKQISKAIVRWSTAV